MKAVIKILAVFLVVILLSGCFGNFQLTRNLYNWNSNVGDDFANTAVMWVMIIVPVYEACGFIDFFILNVVEFWTGENPMSMAEGDVDIQIIENEGKTYEIKASKNRFDITQLEGEDAGSTVALIYNSDDNSWYLDSEDQLQQIAAVEDGFLNLYYPDGSSFKTDFEVK